MANTEHTRYIIDVRNDYRCRGLKLVDIRVEEFDNNDKVLNKSQSPGFHEGEFIIDVVYAYMKKYVLDMCESLLKTGKQPYIDTYPIDLCSILKCIDKLKFKDQELELMLRASGYNLYLAEGIKEKLGECKFTQKYLFPVDGMKILDDSVECKETIALVYSEKKKEGCIFIKAGIMDNGIIIKHTYRAKNLKEIFVPSSEITQILLRGVYAVSFHEEFETEYKDVEVQSSIDNNHLETRILMASGWIKKYTFFPRMDIYGIGNFKRGLLSCTKKNPTACLEACALTNLVEYIEDRYQEVFVPEKPNTDSDKKEGGQV